MSDTETVQDGRLTNISPGGAGFVETDDQTVFIPPGKLNEASTGDRVGVVTEKPPRPEQNLYAEGRVEAVKESGNGTITGRVIHREGRVVIQPTDDEYFVAIEDNPPAVGARVRARLIDDGQRAVVEDVIESGRSSVTSVVQDELAVHEVPEPYTNPGQHRRDIRTDWSSDNRVDATDEMTLTIDPPDAEDYDDAVSIRPTQDGWEVGVHIADVTHYLKNRSPLQNRARKRAFTLYLPGEDTRRMLPDQLSEELSSLRADGPRPALTARLTINRDGEITDYDFEEGIVDVNENLSYSQADDQIGSETTIGRTLQHLQEVAHARRERRQTQGALLIEKPERSIDPESPKRVQSRTRSKTSHMIEELMISANIAAARFLREHDAPFLYRTHEPPATGDLKDVRSVLERSGFEVPNPLTPANLSRTLSDVAEDADDYEYAALSKVVLSNLNAARYSPTAEPHYGIGGSFYTHFTSPIRRFPDLMNHRTIRDALRGRTERWDQRSKMLNGYAGFLVEREKTYRTIEFALKDRLQLDDLKHSHRSGPYRGIVVGGAQMGSFVYLENHVEGLLKGQDHRLGVSVTVTIDRVDPEGNELDLSLVED